MLMEKEKAQKYTGYYGSLEREQLIPEMVKLKKDSISIFQHISKDALQLLW